MHVYVYGVCVCACVGQRLSHMFSSITLHIAFSNPVCVCVCVYTHMEVGKQLGVLGVSFSVYEGYKVQVNSGHQACRARTFAH